MSMVTVHGPNTMYTTQAGVVMSSPAGASATQDPTNGLRFTFALVTDSPRADRDFSWAFPTDGTPTPQTVESPTLVTYATPGAKTATLTVTNVARTITNKALTSNVATLTSNAHGFLAGQTVVVAGVDATFNGTYVITAVTANTFSYAKTNADVTSAVATGTATPSGLTPAAGAYTIAVTATAGQPRSVERSVEAPTEYDPGEHTVDEVMEYANAHPDDARWLYDMEVAGKNRVTLVSQLEALMPYDPGEWTVPDVVAYAQENPAEVPDIIAAEEAGKNRSSLLGQLRAMV